MIETTSQIKYIGEKRYFLPYTVDDQEAIENFKHNQLVRQKTYSMSAEKQRSNKQLNLLMAACQYVADNTEDKHWNTKNKVKFQIKVATDFRDPNTVIVDPHGDIHFLYRSFSFANLKHMEACRIFDRGFDFMADFLKMDRDEFIAAVKDAMQNRYV